MSYHGVTFLLAAAIGIAFAAYQYYTQKTAEPHYQKSSRRSQYSRQCASEKCVICMEKVTFDLEFLSCAHMFHSSCLQEWFRTNKSCPICRTPAY